MEIFLCGWAVLLLLGLALNYVLRRLERVPKQLIVKPKRSGAVILGILCPVYVLVMVWVYPGSYQAGKSLGYLLATGVVMLAGLPYRKSRSTYLEILLENGESAAKIPYSSAMERAEDIVPFVTYYQEKQKEHGMERN